MHSLTCGIGSFAAWWQSTYNGYVTKRALFTYFQRLGMIWGRVPKAAAGMGM